MKNLFIIVNVDTFLLSHRKEVALAAKQNGFDVTIVTHDTGKRREIERMGFSFIDLPDAKSIQNMFREFQIFKNLFLIYKKYKPDIVHHVGLKIILYGTVAARLANIRNIVNAVSGLGVLFS